MIEPTPKYDPSTLNEALALLGREDLRPVFNKIEQKYLYWDKVKYLCPKSINPTIFWQAVKFTRTVPVKTVKFGNHHFHFTITEKMLALLHKFDLNFGGSLSSEGALTPNDRKYFLSSSIMEEAIASSQMEGANTTRKVAKDMLRRQLTPKNKSERMILNNYETIKFISENSEDTLCEDLILRLHKMISFSTLDDTEDEGKFRDHDDILVMNAINGEIAHVPPAFSQIPDLIKDVCTFANEDNKDGFIHPIIKGIIIHFMLAYIHPFCDGNGRTARSLIYWYLLKHQYWFVQYLSISRIIYRSKAKYEKTFLCTEHDDNDLSYFILYHLEVMDEAFTELKSYLSRKIHERSSLQTYFSLPNVSQRQAYLLKGFADNPETVFSAKELANRFGVNPKSIRTDLKDLMKIGLVVQVPINGREYGYKKSERMEMIIETLSKNGPFKDTSNEEIGKK
ncbi:MAG: Fic family protein [Bacteroidales bacterium]|nr:Fic family protein [Bacteroidales bacterium]